MKTHKNILRLISCSYYLKLKASDGSRLICEATDVFEYISRNFVQMGINKPGIATLEMPIQVHNMIDNGTFMDIFQALPGNWNQKWIPQDKVIDFCKTLSTWLRQQSADTFFLVKKDENKPINEENPGDNLVVVNVHVHSDGLRVSVSHLENDYVWHGECLHRVVSPQLKPLDT